MKFDIKEEEGETAIYQRLSLSTYKGIVKFMNDRHYRSRNRAIDDLLNIGLTVCEKIDRIKDPEFVTEIKAQMQEGGLVDYVNKLNPTQFEILWNIVTTEFRDRNRKLPNEKI